MELKEYIETVLVDICEAVSEAKRKTEKIAAIAPASVEGKVVDNGQLVDFEILVAASNSSQKEVSGKIQVIGIGGKADNTQEIQKTNKIKFQVPIYFSASFIKK